jgi:fatty acid desaturase
MTRDIREYIDAAELQALYQRQPWRYLRDGLAIWTVILGAIAAALLSGNIFVTILAFAVVAGRQLALNNMVHEASHYLLSRNKELNDWLSDVFFAAPHLISTDGYRGKHLPHHTHLGHPPEDVEFKARYLFRGRRFLWRSLWAVAGGTSLVTAASYGSRSSNNPNGLRAMVLIALTNGALLAYCWALGSPWAYFYLWLLPLLTLAGYLGTLRVVAEHQPESYAQWPEEDFESPLEPPLTRSIPAGPIARFFVAPLNFCYHFEHHAFPAIPYASLPKLHRLLHERGFFKDHPESLGTGYGAVLTSLIRANVRGAGRPHE